MSHHQFVFNTTQDTIIMSKVVAYYGSWAIYRPDGGKYAVENIDPSIITHAIYSFVGLNDDGTIKLLDPWNDLPDNGGHNSIKKFNNLKKRNPRLKTLVAMGGWNEGSEKYSRVIGDSGKRSVLVRSAVEFLGRYGFDGFDIDWEYPNQRGGKPSDIDAFSSLVKELHSAFAPHGYLLTAAVAAAEFSMSQSYNVPILSKYLDHIHVMSYDFHGAWDGKTGHNAPLDPSRRDVTQKERELNVKACIETWIRKGADPRKIILGVGFYGRSFSLNSTGNPSMGVPATAGQPGPYTKEAGNLGYNEIAFFQKNGGWTVQWDEEQKVPYMYKGNQLVSYDNERSIQLKINYAKLKGLGGFMAWSIETDDFSGISGKTYPLLKTLYNNA